MTKQDFVETNKELLYTNFLQEHYNHCEDVPDSIDELLLYEFEANEYEVSKEKLRNTTQKRPSQLRIRPSNKLLKTLIKKDTAKLDGVVVGDYAVLYPVWVK